MGIALGQDDIADAYYPYGRNNMLEVAFLESQLKPVEEAEDESPDRSFQGISVPEDN